MKIFFHLILTLGLIFSFFNSQSQQAEDEIIFYSNGSTFSPVIVLQAEAEILWTWDDNTTSNSATPIKEYGTEQVRKNTLKVTPWSAVRRINIGYDAQDGGSTEIEFVEKQNVSKVENLHLVAPYLKEWCSSYNIITSLDFSNFVNLETIECFLCQSLQNINLTNTSQLKRICFEVNGLLNLDISDSNVLEQVRVSSNKFNDIILPENTENIWHMCTRENTQLTNQVLFNDLSNYPNMADLFIWASNQLGELVIPKTHPSRWVGIRAYDNHYTSIDLRGSMQNPMESGYVDMHNNKLTKVEIAGCHQIKYLDLSQNLLSAETVDYVLRQLDEFGPTITPRTVNLSNNQPPTEQGLIYKKNLEAKQWSVIVDFPSSINELNDLKSFDVFPNPSNGNIKLRLNILPAEGVMVEITNVLGQKLMEKKINDTETEWDLNEFSGSIIFITLKGTNLFETKRILVN